ncbi:hypothetical protein PI124_g2738 [Phytophthora idaei]|nr:hypothetical protein PI125_g7049 [Phytophthora idaei]KAG3168034.1 hypothetical protein PI126_g3511 [Phytophthora idaei]KAG3252659.1 hypothetical protein PI124_g2738 [Phytophthora idaei]
MTELLTERYMTSDRRHELQEMHNAVVVFAFLQGTATPTVSADRMVANFCFEGCGFVAAQREAY